jgi:hypothetical protein
MRVAFYAWLFDTIQANERKKNTEQKYYLNEKEKNTGWNS